MYSLQSHGTVIQKNYIRLADPDGYYAQSAGTAEECQRFRTELANQLAYITGMKCRFDTSKPEECCVYLDD